MPRFRRQMALRPVQRIKHIVDQNAALGANTTLIVDVVSATDTPTLGATTSVITGSKVYGIYIKALIASNEAIDLGAIPNVYFAVRKNPAGNLSVESISTLGDSDEKRYYLHQEMSMIENKGQGSNATVLFNGVVKIPKSMSRMGPGDKIQVVWLSPAIDVVVCLQAHYKEFR